MKTKYSRQLMSSAYLFYLFHFFFIFGFAVKENENERALL